jgi:hypothetical protein
VQPQEESEKVVINGRQLGHDSIRRFLLPHADVPERTSEPGQALADERLETFLRLPKSRFEILQEMGAGGFGQVQFTIA